MERTVPSGEFLECLHCAAGQCEGSLAFIQIIDCVGTDITSDDESREALRYLEGIWQNRLVTMAANGNINHMDEMTARGNRIPGTIRNLLNM